MHSRRAFTALGAGLTTGLLVAVLVIEILPFELSALVGLPVGILAGLTTLAAVAVAFDGFDAAERRALTAYAAFGAIVVAVSVLNYLNVAGGTIEGMSCGHCEQSVEQAIIKGDAEPAVLVDVVEDAGYTVSI